MSKEDTANMTTSKDNQPVVFTLPDNIENIFKYNEKPNFSIDIDYPKFSLGFQHYIHQSKTKMEITKEFEGKKKVFNVINKFEINIDDYSDDIATTSKKYFNISKTPDILNNSFFKLWEILLTFDIVDIKEDNFVSVHLSDRDGSFAQATMFYRDTFCDEKKNISKNDQYHIITHYDENLNHIDKIDSSVMKQFTTKRVQLTVPKSKADLVTSNGGVHWDNDNVQEQEALPLIISQIIMAAKHQKDGGNFVCKLYESFTNMTTKIIAILNSFYNKVHIIKPLTSRASKSEKFAVCMDFKSKSKDNNDKIKKLENILEMTFNNKGKNLVDIFPDFMISNEFKTTMILMNTEIANKQFIAINLIIDFIKKQNYRGDEYNNRREMQINSSKYWINNFLISSKEFTAKRKEINEVIKNIIISNQKLIDSMLKKLEF